MPPPSPPSGPFPGPGPGPYGGPPGPPRQGSSSTPLILAAVAVVAVIGVIFAVVSGSSGGDKDGTATGDMPGAQTDDGGDLGGVPLPGQDDDADTGTPDPVETLPPVTDPPIEPAKAEVNDCISVDAAGNFLGTGSCSDGGATYEVVEVVDGFGTCSDANASYTPSGGYLLCLHVNLVETYCYQGIQSWVTPADGCELPGTVHVIDIVPGVDNGDHCTTNYEWNRWYSFTAPEMVACVMEY